MTEKTKPQRIKRKSLQELSPSEMEQRKTDICNALVAGTISMGQAAKLIRTELSGLSQQEFSRFVKLSRQTISDIENDKSDLTIRSVNKLFSIIGMELRLAPKQKVCTLKLHHDLNLSHGATPSHKKILTQAAFFIFFTTATRTGIITTSQRFADDSCRLTEQSFEFTPLIYYVGIGLFRIKTSPML